MLKAYRKKQMVFAVKLNPLEKPKPLNEPTWLSEFEDVFPEEHPGVHLSYSIGRWMEPFASI